MQRAFAELIRRIHDRYDLVVFAGELEDGLRDLVTWRRIPVPLRPAPLRFALFYFIAAARLAREKVDVVHTLGAIVPNKAHVASVHFCNAGFVAAVGRLAPANAPLVRRINTGMARMIGLLAERWSYRRARIARLAPVSAGLARELDRHYPDSAVVVTPNGVDHHRFQPDPRSRMDIRRRLGLPEDEIVALFVGGDWHLKGLGIAIQAIREASARCDNAIRLLVVGRGDAAYFRRLAAACGVEDRVVFLGHRPDPERFYAAADVFVLPTLYETFSLAAFEAAASGLPVIAPPVSGIEELVEDGGAGVPVSRDAASVGAALAELASSPEARHRLGAVGRRRAAAFSWNRSAEATEAIYRLVESPELPTRETAAA